MQQSQHHTDIIIIGAGAAGLLAGKLLAEQGKTVCILEARDRLGGRIHTLADEEWNTVAEAGAEFIHGNLELTFELLKEAGLKKVQINGEMWRVINGDWQKDEDDFEKQEKVVSKLKTLEEDMSMKAFLAKEFSGDENAEVRQTLTGYIEGYYAGDANLASAKKFLVEWQSEDEEQYRPVTGYDPLLQYILTKFQENGGILQLSTIVKQINYLQNSVEVIDINLQKYTATKAIITVPLGVWRAEENEQAFINYNPALPQKKEAALQMGFGSVVKILLQFEEPFWQQEAFKNRDIGFLFSDQNIGTWWTQNPNENNVLTGWLAGPRAYVLRHSDDAIIFEQAMASLQNVFNINKEKLETQLLHWKVFNWTADPFTLGAYSYSTIYTSVAQKVLSMPVENTLFFAGEALYAGTETGTVEAAFTNGRDVVRQLLSTF